MKAIQLIQSKCLYSLHKYFRILNFIEILFIQFFISRSGHLKSNLLMDKWILGNNLDILNTEKTPTFLTSRAQSIIDVSLAYKAKNHISNWHVKNQYFFSDHRCIQFILFSKEFVPPTVQVTSWPSFRNALNLEEKRYKLWTRSIIEREAEALEGAINTALAASSANIPLRSNPTHFWNNDLEKSRRLSLNLDRHMQNRPSSSVKSDFENAKNIILKL